MQCKILTVKFVTYNLHGFNQGYPYLCDLLHGNDIVCVQEHWLSRPDLPKLTAINSDFVVYSSTAMDDVLNRGLLRGRPFGGVAIFVKGTLATLTKVICKTERFIVIKIGNTFVFNVYMPCNDSEMFTDILAAILNCLGDVNNCKIIGCGDFNMEFLTSHPLWAVFSAFLTGAQVMCIDDRLTDPDSVSYCH
jgi:exonuclease III